MEISLVDKKAEGNGVFMIGGKKIISLLITILTLSAQTALGQAKQFTELDAYVKKTMDEWRVPGLAVAIVKDDRVVYAKGFGVRATGKNGQVNERTLFAVGSATKSFTAAAFAKLVEEGKLKWDDPVVKYLPDFQLYDPYVTREITVRDILSHRSGLPRAVLSLMLPYSRTEVARRMRYLQPAAGFRARFSYQNQLYQVAGLVLEKVTGQTWEAYVAENIFKRLGMKESNTSIGMLKGLENVALPHASIAGEVRAIPYRNHDNTGPAGAINSNAVEMAEWLRLQLGSGAYADKKIINPNLLRDMQSPQTVIPTGALSAKLFPTTHFQAYGMGWFLRDYRGHKIIEHGGNVDGMTAQMGMLPKENLGVIILSNMEATPLPQILMYKVFDTFLGGDSGVDLNAENLKSAQETERLRAEQRKQLEAKRVTGTKPPLPLGRYAGTYTNDLYGEAQISYEEGKLIVRFNSDVIGAMEYWGNNAFWATWSDPYLDAYAGKTVISFSASETGEVKQLEAENIGKFVRNKPTGVASARHDPRYGAEQQTAHLPDKR